MDLTERLAVPAAILVLLTGSIGLVQFRLRDWWSGERSLPGTPPPGWSWGGAAWRGYVRCLCAVGIVSLPGMLIAAWSFMVRSVLPASVQVSSLLGRCLAIVAMVGAAFVVLGLILACFIFFVNRPRSLVPPRYRGQRGVLLDWLA